MEHVPPAPPQVAAGGGRRAAEGMAGQAEAEKRAVWAWGVARAHAEDAADAWKATGKWEEIVASAGAAELAGIHAPGRAMGEVEAAATAAAYGTHNAWLQRAAVGRFAAKSTNEMAAVGRHGARKRRAPTDRGRRRTAALRAAARASREAVWAWELAATQAERAAARGAGGSAE